MYNPQLETFIAVADAGSFAKAADNLYVSSTAIIKQMNLLENKLNLKLFDRTHRGLLLTEAGKSIYRDAKYIIQYSKDSLVRAENAMRKGAPVIRIGTSPVTPAEVLVDLWPQTHSICPDIKFKLVPFGNTQENVREILMNLGQNIDMVAGIFDSGLLHTYQCEGLELRKEPICVAVSINHPLAEKDALDIKDLYGEHFMLIRRGWVSQVDILRDDLYQNHPQIHTIDFDFYSTETFNQCENSNYCLMAIPSWQSVHPLLKIIPVKWAHMIPFGLMYSPEPSPTVRACIDAIVRVCHSNQSKPEALEA